MMPPAYDVAVIGGGPAGSAAAILLARAGRRVVLLDAAPAEAFKIGESLAPAAKRLLTELDVFERFAADGHLPSYGTESAWGSRFLRRTDSILDPDGNGWRLDRARFDRMLRQEARRAGARVFEQTRATDLQRSDGGWKIAIGRSEEVPARWLLDCSGRSAWVARRERAGRIRHDHLIAIHRRFESPAGTDQDSLTLIESTPEGWWYTARLPSDGHRLAVFFTDAMSEACKLARTGAGFAELLAQTEHIRARMKQHGYIAGEAPRATAANSGWLAQFAGDGWLAAGDAAISCDPLSSQGILNALYSGVQAARALDAGLSGDRQPLLDYPRLMENVRRAFERNLQFFYSMEHRWPNAAFWIRRQAAVSPLINV